MDASDEHEQHHEQEPVPEHEHEQEQTNDQDQAPPPPHDAPLPDSDEHNEHDHTHPDERPTRPCGHAHDVRPEEEEADEGDAEAVEHEHATELCVHEAVYHHHEHDDIPPHEHKEHAGDPQAQADRSQEQQAQHDEEVQPHGAVPEGAIEAEHSEQQHTHEPLLEAATVVVPEGPLQPAGADGILSAGALPDRPMEIEKPVGSFARGNHNNANASRRRTSERYHASAEQLRLLIQAFQQDPTPSAATLHYLSTTIGMPMHNMVLWFKNRRARHKKHHPSQTAVKTGRRSYVKSGIYARASKKGKVLRDGTGSIPMMAAAAVTSEDHHAEVRGDTTREVADVGRPSIASQGETDMHQVALLAAAVEAGAPLADIVGAPAEGLMDSVAKNEVLDGIGSEKRRLEDGSRVDGMPPTKRTRYQGVSEVVGDANPCRVWNAKECHRRCCAFFAKSTSGCEQPEQTKSAQRASEMFFLGELQNGLTLTSAMQSLETSAGVLDKIMDRIRQEGQSVKLSSGSRAVLREFVAQVRSGQAIHVHIEAHGDVVPKEEYERPRQGVIEVTGDHDERQDVEEMQVVQGEEQTERQEEEAVENQKTNEIEQVEQPENSREEHIHHASEQQGEQTPEHSHTEAVVQQNEESNGQVNEAAATEINGEANENGVERSEEQGTERGNEQPIEDGNGEAEAVRVE